jgi:large subunit ribosomal protein L32
MEQKLSNRPYTLKDLIGDGFLWAVPKHRRSIERRMKRKYGNLGQHFKFLVPKTHLRVCNTCGGDYEVGVLCREYPSFASYIRHILYLPIFTATCYKKVRDETEQMQTKIQEELKLDPVDREVIVLYDREKENMSEEFWRGKRIVEMQKPRPMWFSKNLIEKTTQQPADTTEVKPDKLG